MKQHIKTAILAGQFLPYGEFYPITIGDPDNKKRKEVYFMSLLSAIRELPASGRSRVDTTDYVQLVKDVLAVKGDKKALMAAKKMTEPQARVAKYIVNLAAAVDGLISTNPQQAKDKFNSISASYQKKVFQCLNALYMADKTPDKIKALA